MYTDMYNTFDDERIPYSYPFSFQEERKEYLAGTKPTYEMNFGDTLVIPFQIGCEYCGNYINMVVYNFRHEEILCQTELTDEEGKVYLNIDDEISNTIFRKGIYYIQVQAEGLVGTMIVVKTLLPAENCTLYVR